MLSEYSESLTEGPMLEGAFKNFVLQVRLELTTLALQVTVI